MRNTVFGIIVLVIAVGAAVYAYSNNTSRGTWAVEEARIQTLVTDFGSKLQMVSLLASTTERAAALELYYGPYVAPELLATWKEDGSDALGRYTSSPWPERIEIATITRVGKNYVVEGNVVEVAQSASSTQIAAIYPITLALEKRAGRWLIVKVDKGEYHSLP